jgi:hypothetical protein
MKSNFSVEYYRCSLTESSENTWETRISRFSVETRIFSVETRIFSVETCSFSVEKRAFSVEYLLVLYDGGGGGGGGGGGKRKSIKSQSKPCGLKGTL